MNYREKMHMAGIGLKGKLTGTTHIVIFVIMT